MWCVWGESMGSLVLNLRVGWCRFRGLVLFLYLTFEFRNDFLKHVLKGIAKGWYFGGETLARGGHHHFKVVKPRGDAVNRGVRSRFSHTRL
jgi:hypothetical protein